MVCMQLVAVVLGLLIANDVRVCTIIVMLLAQVHRAQHPRYLCQSQDTNLRARIWLLIQQNGITVLQVSLSHQ